MPRWPQLCDTFFPADNGVPSASELGVVDALLGAVAANPRAAERRQLARLLTIWDPALLTGLGGGGLRRLSALDQAQRERVLLSWCDSRLPQRRAAFQALRNGSLLVSYMLSNPDGSPNPVWDAMGFPGPLGKKADAAPKLALGRSTARVRRSSQMNRTMLRTKSFSDVPVRNVRASRTTA